MNFQRLPSGTRVVETEYYLSAGIEHFCFDRLAQDRGQVSGRYDLGHCRISFYFKVG
jgi:predicted DCC family thiol-disulfide oxidoreductase YuxK